MGIYVQQQLEYGKLWKLVEFSQVPGPRTHPPPDIAVHLHVSCPHLLGDRHGMSTQGEGQQQMTGP